VTLVERISRLEIAEVARVSAIIGRYLIEGKFDELGVESRDAEYKFSTLKRLSASLATEIELPLEGNLWDWMRQSLIELAQDDSIAVAIERSLPPEGVMSNQTYGLGKEIGLAVFGTCCGLALLIAVGKIEVSITPETYTVEVHQDLPPSVERLVKQLVSIIPEVALAISDRREAPGGKTSHEGRPLSPAGDGTRALPKDLEGNRLEESGELGIKPKGTTNGKAEDLTAVGDDESQDLSGSHNLVTHKVNRFRDFSDVRIESQLTIEDAMEVREQILELCNNSNNLPYLYEQTVAYP